MRTHGMILACFMFCCFTGSHALSDRPPNIVFIVADDLGWSDLTCYGSDFHQTPHIDALAAEGMRFTSAYASPNCAPTRACLMSGQYSPRHGIYTVSSGERGPQQRFQFKPVQNETVLSLDIPTWAERVREAGYFTAHVGKWHLGNPPTHGPQQQGFDVNIGGYHLGRPRGGYFSPYRNPALEDGPDGEYLTDRLVDETLNLIRAHRQKPFFIYLPHYAPHTPIQAKEEDIAYFANRPVGEHHRNVRYAAMIRSVDQGVGRIMALLKELNLDDHTIVIFYSDNGHNGRASNSHLLRGAKGMLYEGGVRVPLIVRWPGVVQPGSVCDEPVQHVDFYPTFLEITGAQPAPSHVLDGLSMLPLLQSAGQARLERDAIFWHFPGYLGGRLSPATAMRARDWKLIEFFEDGGTLELYNLAQDIGEQRNLADQMPEKRDALHALMLQWRRHVNAPMPEPLSAE